MHLMDAIESYAQNSLCKQLHFLISTTPSFFQEVANIVVHANEPGLDDDDCGYIVLDGIPSMF